MFAPATVQAQSLSLAWNASTDATVVGYTVHVGLVQGVYTQTFDVSGINTTTFTFTQPIPGQQYYFAVSAYDAAGLPSALSNVVSGKINVGPTLAQPANQTGAVGAAQSFQLTATDDGDPLTYTAAGLPPGLSIAAGTGVISGTPTTAGSYFVAVAVSDGIVTVGRSFTWTINPRVSVTSFTTSVPSPQNAGTAITLSAIATAGVAPYQYKFRSTFGSTTAVLRNWSTASTHTWTPTQAGTHLLEVWVRSAGATADAPEGSMTRSFVVDPPAGTLVIDTFTGSSTLAAHAPDVNRPGTPWMVTGAMPAPTVSSGVTRVASGAGHVQATINTGVSDFTMTVDCRIGSGPYLAALAFRLTDANNHLLLTLYGGAVNFYQKQNGAFTLLASQSIGTVTAGSTHRLELRAAGSMLQAWLNGSLKLQASSVFQQTATRHGLGWNSAYDAGTTYDTFELRTSLSVAPPAVPTAPSPGNGASGIGTTPTLSWSASGATSYEVRFGTTSTPAVAATGLTGGSYTPSGLAASTTYYWQIVARNGAGATTGPVWSFTTAAPASAPAPPGLPATPSPANGAAAVPTTTALAWSATGATNYDVRFGTSSPPPQVSSGQAVASYTPGSLTANTTYYWQVVARNAAGTATGPVWSFTTAAAAAGLLVSDTFTSQSSVSLPMHGPDVNVTGSTWTVTGSTPVPTVSGGAARVGNGSGHLQATINSGTSDFKMAVDCRIGSHGYLAALAFRLTDANNHLLLIAYGDTLQFYRKENGTYTLLNSQSIGTVTAGQTYRLELRAVGSKLEAYWNGLLRVQASSSFQQTATRHGLAWNSAYDPTVTYDNFDLRTYGSGGSAATSTASPAAAPEAPNAPTPGSGTSGIAMTPALTWTASGATSYDVRFGTSNPPASAANNLSAASYSPGALFAATTYYWQVVARNTNGTTTGPVWSFTTGAASSNMLIADTFTGANGTALSTHAADVNGTGSAWTVTGSTPAPRLLANAVGVTAGTGYLQATVNSGISDVRMAVDCRIGSHGYLAALAFRLTDANNHLLLIAYGDTLQFYRKENGTYTLLNSQSIGTVTAGQTYRLELRATGSTLEAYWNGRLRVQASSSFQQTATRHGLAWNSAYDPTVTYDNFELKPAQ